MTPKSSCRGELLSNGTDLYTYRRTEEKPLLKRNSSRERSSRVLFDLYRAVSNVSLGLFVTGIVGFFLSRALFWGELLPFAPAFAAAVAVSYGNRGWLTVFFMCAGMATVLQGHHLAANIVLAIFSFVSVRLIPYKYSKRKLVVPFMIFGLTLSVKSVFFAFFNATPYDYINVFFESLLAAVLVSACLVSLASVRKLDGVQALHGEETVCILLLMAGIIAGAGDIQIWQVSVKGLLSKAIILLSAMAGGAGLGAAAGAMVGIIPSLAYAVTPSMVGVYSFIGLLAGFGRTLGKIGVAVAFLASNIILTLYFNNITGMISVVAETTLACLVFLLVPEGAIRRVSSSMLQEVNKEQNESDYQHMSEVFREKIREYSLIFRELAKVFGESSFLAEKQKTEDEVRQLLEEISKKVCVGCSMLSLCWEKEYYRTYQSMLDLFAMSESNDRLKVTDIPDDLKIRCTRSRELAITATCLYQTFKVGSYWNNKFSAGRIVVGEQLRGMSSVIEDLADDFALEHCACQEADLSLKHKLRQLGIPVREVKVSQAENRCEIQVAMRACQGQLDCRYKLVPLISDLLGQVYSVAGCICEGSLSQDTCRFRLYQCPQYQVEVGYADAAKDGGVSGDSYDFVQLKGGRFAAVLSDGMGSGEGAARESTSVLRVIRRMLEAGLDLRSAVKSVNSVLALKSSEESFATLDMSVINIYNGQAEFVKIAAPPTYLIRGGKVKSIQVNSLPVGILNDIDVSITERRLISGDVIVMMTDGVMEACPDAGDKDGWIIGALLELDGLAPREMAQLLLKLAQTCNEDVHSPVDDMAVVVIKIEKEKVIEMSR